MKYKNIKLYGCIIIIVLLALCMIIIFMFSSQDYQNTNKMSEKITEKIAKVFFADYEKMDSSTKGEIIFSLNKFIRKVAHFSMYFLMGFLLYLGSLFLKFKNKYRVLVIMGICIFYAVSDEIHQLFVAGRNSQFKDVIIDSSGALLGVILCFALIATIEKAFHKNFD